MRIHSTRILNYKSFNETEVISFASQFNVVIGKNNSGKSAFLKALTLNTSNEPHKSLRTLPETTQTLQNTDSVFEFVVTYERDEVKRYAKSRGHIVIPTSGNTHDQQIREFDRLIDTGLKLSITRKAESLVDYRFVELAAQTDLGIKIDINESGDFVSAETIRIRNSDQLLSKRLADIAYSNVFYFNAERLNISRHRTGLGDHLDSSAANLPKVIHNLQSNTFRFNRYQDLVHSVFPEITLVTAPLVGDNEAGIKIWEIDPSTERSDLAIPIESCGTGISQVLAMLYVVVTSVTPHIILIDEPQSFLHPGAVQRLFEIFRQNPLHQYIVTTHSPNVIALCDSPAVILIKKENMQSNASTLDATSVTDMHLALVEVGARASDVFGADNILWVEGPTEAECFPIILKMIAHKNLLGTKIVSIVNTGDLEAKHAERVVEIYGRLSAGYGYIPPALAFLLDRENKSSDLQAKLKARTRGQVHFLPRKMFENYLLDKEAITHVMQELPEFAEQPIDIADIQTWFDANAWNSEYIDSPSDESERTEQYWLDNVHGAKVLEALFKNFGNHYPYDKIRHGKELTSYIAKHKRENLQGIAEWLAGFLS